MRYKMIVPVVFIFLLGCEKEIEVTSIDHIPGTWRWESTCGGETDYTCVNASKENYATIEFRTDGVYVEKHMDTIYLQTNYSILKSDDMFGTLVLEDPYVSRPLTIINNGLIIQRGSYEDNYSKIK